MLKYLEYVVDKFGLAGNIELNQRVSSASFDKDSATWRVVTESGDTFAATYLLTAVGNLSEPLVPDYEGLSDFTGAVYSTGRWPHEEVDLKGKRVAVIGTGSSGIQIVPAIADEVGSLTVFQRTANYAIPARNHPMRPEDEKRIKANYAAIREEARWTPTGNLAWPDPRSALKVSPEERRRRYEKDWEVGGFQLLIGGYNDFLVDEEANATVADFVREKISQRVKDPEKLKKLLPTDHPIGSKRPPLDEKYFETFNRDNVDIVDLKTEPIVRITPTGIKTANAEYELDVIIFATGFDAVTGALNKIDIRNAEGVSLKEGWVDGPRTYLGVAAAGFPNLFMISGPQSPSVMATVTQTIEQHIEWIGDLINFNRAHGDGLVEATVEAQDAWVTHVNDIMSGTLMGKVNSWYVGANVEGKPRAALTYVGGLGAYRKHANEIRDMGYEGFTFTSRDGQPLGVDELIGSAR